MNRETMQQEPVAWLDAEMSQAYTISIVREQLQYMLAESVEDVAEPEV